MIKVAINTRYGGFGISTEAMMRLIKSNSKIVKVDSFKNFGHQPTQEDIDDMVHIEGPFWVDFVGVIYNSELEVVYYLELNSIEVRTDPELISIIEELGPAANGPYAKIELIQINDPDITIDDIEIQTNDAGPDWVAEKHRTWG